MPKKPMIHVIHMVIQFVVVVVLVVVVVGVCTCFPCLTSWISVAMDPSLRSMDRTLVNVKMVACSRTWMVNSCVIVLGTGPLFIAHKDKPLVKTSDFSGSV